MHSVAASSTISSRFGKTTILKEIFDGLGTKDPGNLEDLLKGVGKKFFTGTEFVDGGGYPSGIDTVPAWLTAGERILTVDQNKQLGGISNDQLVEKFTYFDRLAAQFPQLINPWSDMANTRFTLPEGLLNSTGGTSVDLSGLRDDLRAVETAIKNQKTFDLTVDKGG